jgi:hypothetical protein
MAQAFEAQLNELRTAHASTAAQLASTMARASTAEAGAEVVQGEASRYQAECAALMLQLEGSAALGTELEEQLEQSKGVLEGCMADMETMYGARSPQKLTLEDAIGSHACSLEANTRVTNGIPLGSSLLLPVHTVNSATTPKGNRIRPALARERIARTDSGRERCRLGRSTVRGEEGARVEREPSSSINRCQGT